MKSPLTMSLTVFIGASEMGQGTHTALSMIIADELEADWKQVRVRQGPAAKEYHNPLLRRAAHRGKRDCEGVL